MLLRTQYRKLLDFAFIPHNILNAVRIRDNAVGDHLLAYLCFAFERAGEENMIVEEDRVLFAPGLRNSRDSELYCCFAANKNQKQPWALVRIDTWQGLRWPFRGMRRPKPVNALSDFNASLHSFAFVPHQRLEAIAPFFCGDVNYAMMHIAFVFECSNKYGYIAFCDDRAVFNTGLHDDAESIYAVFSRNPEPLQPWILEGFMPESAVTRFDLLPAFVLGEAETTKRYVTTSSTVMSNAFMNDGLQVNEKAAMG